MALDAILLGALTAELSEKLTGARIDRVQQPERDRIILSVRNHGENMRVLLCAGTGSGRINLTAAAFENPAEPPMFCMLLRKYLVSGHITGLTQPGHERLLIIDIGSHNEMGDAIELRLVLELIGRSTNLILVGADGRIIDCLRRMDFGGDAERRMLPGMIYRLPPKQPKPQFFETDSDQRLRMLMTAEDGRPLDKTVLGLFAGLSPLICRELVCRCNNDPALLPDAMDALFDSVTAGEMTPTLVYSDGKPAEFSFMSLKQYGAGTTEEVFPDFSSLLDAYYSGREKAESRRRRSKELMHSVKTLRDRTAKKLSLQQEELKRTENREDIRRKAELLTANMFRVKKGEGSVTVEDYYSGGTPLTIELDRAKSPQQNAAAMFREYNKLKAAEAHLTKLIAEGEKQLDYLNSVLDETERAETEQELSEIRRELYDMGFIKKHKNDRQTKIKPSKPFEFISSDGFKLLVGRNNRQNDELTLKTARRTDLWLHTKSVHGSHVIICCEGAPVPESTVAEAASLAVYYSQAREAGKTLVDITQVKFVKKPAGALPGMVVYTDQRTVSADAALASHFFNS